MSKVETVKFGRLEIPIKELKGKKLEDVLKKFSMHRPHIVKGCFELANVKKEKEEVQEKENASSEN